jgi:anti-sigma regulatory factor (Ser/Thr protein kinase)
VLRLAVDDPAAAVLVLQVVPIGIVAAAWGYWAGLSLAAASMAALAAWATVNEVELGVVGYLVRGAVFATAGLAPALWRGAREAAESTPDLVLALPPSLEAPGLARGALERFERALSPDRLYEAKLLTTELVTNAVKHGRITEGVELRATLTDDALRVDVRDEGRVVRPTSHDLAPQGVGGIGLHVVDLLSTRWAVRHHGSRAWFEIGRRD